MIKRKMIHNCKQQMEEPLANIAQKHQLTSTNNYKYLSPKYKSTSNYLGSYNANNTNILKTKNSFSQKKEKYNKQKKKLKIKLNIENKNDDVIKINRRDDLFKSPEHQNQKSEVLIFPKIKLNKINDKIINTPEIKKKYRNIYLISKNNCNITDDNINSEPIKNEVKLKHLNVSKISLKKKKLFINFKKKITEDINKSNKSSNEIIINENDTNEDNTYEKHANLLQKVKEMDHILKNLQNFLDENKNNLSHNITNNNINISEDNKNKLQNHKLPEIPSTQIFNKTFNNFTESICSSPYEFKKSDIIKAYAYNTSSGNIKNYNEDTITAEKIFYNDYDYFCYFAIYDGHGGSGCSSFLQSNLHKNIKNFSTNDLINAIKFTEEEFFNKYVIDYDGKLIDCSGSCACIALIKKNKLIIANIGDSRLILVKNKKIFFTTIDHKPINLSEKKRIKKAGGYIYQSEINVPIFQNGKRIELPWRVFPGGLSVSRTIGDIEVKNEKYRGKSGVVISKPDIWEFNLNEEFNFLVIGCDGIFDVLSNNEILECYNTVYKIYKNNKKGVNDFCGDFASMIIKSALAKDSFDNVSVVVVLFNNLDDII